MQNLYTNFKFKFNKLESINKSCLYDSLTKLKEIIPLPFAFIPDLIYCNLSFFKPY